MLRQTAHAPALVALLAVLLGAGGTVQARTSQWSGPWDLIAFEVRSWGQPVTSWRLLADGSGSWTEAVRDDGAALGEYRLVWHEFAAGEDGYGQVETLKAADNAVATWGRAGRVLRTERPDTPAAIP